MKYYAVKKGRKTGIYTNWPDTQKQVSGFSGAQYKSFGLRQDAEDYLGVSHSKEDSQQLDLPIVPGQILVYTDGGSRSHGNRPGEHVKADDKAAWAFAIQLADDEKQITGTGGEYGATNNRMEIMALVRALSFLVAHDHQQEPILVVSDSRYVLNAITKKWLASWKRRGWKRSAGPLVNAELWQQLDGLLRQFPKINFKWTKGHADNSGNVLVDELLNQTMDAMKHQEGDAPDENVTVKSLPTDSEPQKAASESTQRPERKKRPIKLDTDDIKPVHEAPTHLSPTTEKSVHDIEESLKQLGLFDDDQH
ncbi:ribonuclease H family protein [Lentilactobacillus parafarraginis]|uniref:Ribonuclease H n=1 Tax=Lentilactobacillus parafarraginis DSM 18390 = JCM 14109 TaxID=1423786 RepID=A0A0R1Z052_9LACO|nr:ribonuclease H family protein [Lentilactobacillus parafarraginis]KRM44428.1 ribonuclease HI [Lentilactobacillus parafarraginis DSM 18390 = JCM 14109]